MPKFWNARWKQNPTKRIPIGFCFQELAITYSISKTKGPSFWNLRRFLDTKSNKTHYRWILFPGFDCKGVTKSPSFWNFYPFLETKSNKAHYRWISFPGFDCGTFIHFWKQSPKNHWVLFPGLGWKGLTDIGPLFWYWKQNPKNS